MENEIAGPRNALEKERDRKRARREKEMDLIGGTKKLALDTI